MKKYIRIDNKIYDLSNKYSQTPEEVQIALMTGNYKQADTIEELCDAYVVDYGKTKIVYDELEWAIAKAISSNKMYRIFGAIWTEKGLIYVTTFA